MHPFNRIPARLAGALAHLQTRLDAKPRWTPSPPQVRRYNTWAKHTWSEVPSEPSQCHYRRVLFVWAHLQRMCLAHPKRLPWLSIAKAAQALLGALCLVMLAAICRVVFEIMQIIVSHLDLSWETAHNLAALVTFLSVAVGVAWLMEVARDRLRRDHNIQELLGHQNFNLWLAQCKTRTAKRFISQTGSYRGALETAPRHVRARLAGQFRRSTNFMPPVVKPVKPMRGDRMVPVWLAETYQLVEEIFATVGRLAIWRLCKRVDLKV